MGGTIVDFSGLIAPIHVDAFFSEYWERKPLHIRRDDRAYYDGIITVRDLETLLSSGDLRFPAVRLARNGMYYVPEAYSRNIKFGDDYFNGIPDLDAINREYRSGATVAMPAIHRIWAPVRELCQTLETYFDHPAHANVYITPGDASGFTPHYDTHEVFILQISGKKHWRVFDPPLPLPHRTQTFTPHGYIPTAPLLELDLEPGNLLYLPRGYVHAASTEDSYSAHVTLGITVFTWVELASELLLSSKNLPEFRRALPPGFARNDVVRAAMKEELVRLVDKLRSNFDYGALIDAFSRRVSAGYPKPAPPFHTDVTVIGLHTELNVLEKNSVRITTQNQHIVLKYAGRKLVLSGQYQATLEAICASSRFRPHDLPRYLDDEALLRFIRYLHQEGFLTRESSEDQKGCPADPQP